MKITAQQLAAMSGTTRVNENMNSIIAGLDSYGYEKVGLALPKRLVMYVAQTGHESGSFRYDREVWGPTPAQVRYDTRTDLGNTAAADGDGFLYRGRAGIQITGRANYVRFTTWARERFRNAPDFVVKPDLVNTDPWEGLAPIWYWEVTNLNKYADQGDIEMVTRRINGGLNGYQDRLDRYTMAALVALGHNHRDIHGFQASVGLKADGIAGPKTRGELHKALVAMERR